MIVELRLNDEDSKTVIRAKPPKGGPGGPGGPKFSLNSTRLQIAVTLSQVRELKAADGTIYPPFGPRKTQGAWQELMDLFSQFEYDGMAYDLYIPEGYDPSQKYPLVLFIPDATGGDHPLICLEQGNGAVNFASWRDQKLHLSFVLAVQYSLDGPLTRDDFTVNEQGVRQILGVLDHVLESFSIDRNKVYTTGQSMGCMTSCELNIRRNGAKRGPNRPLLLDRLVEDAARDGHHIRYPVFEGDFVVPDGETANGRTNHMSTWPVVYAIDKLRDWLFTQTKEG